MMDPCVTSCGLTLKVRAIPELALRVSCEDWIKQVYEGKSGREEEGKFGLYWLLPSPCVTGSSSRSRKHEWWCTEAYCGLAHEFHGLEGLFRMKPLAPWGEEVIDLDSSFFGGETHSLRTKTSDGS